MAEKQSNTNEILLDDFVNIPYKYGFKTDIETESFPKGLDLNIVKKISKKKEEPGFLEKFRINAFEQWQRMKNTSWSYLNTPEVDYQAIQYYSIPKTKKKLGSLDEADPEILKTFEKLGVSLNEQKLLMNVAVDIA